MKLIDILVEELPKRGGWPDDSDEIWQSQFDCEIYTESKLLPYFYVGERAEDNGIDNGVTREQYEAALAAKNECWIEWGGGLIPIRTNTFVDVKFNNGDVRLGKIAGEYSWEHVWEDSNIIAYRLHQPQEAGKDKADDEEDMNDCIEQDAAPVWNGEGLPPVGVECEWQDKNTKQWQPVKVVYASEWVTVVREINEERGDDLVEVAIENYGDDARLKFRPILTEAERKRKEAIEQMIKIATIYTTKSLSLDLALNSIYNAIAAGEITGVKLED